MSAELKSDGTVELRMEREFSYPPEKVFEAWLKPESLAKWMGPSDEITVSNIQVDAVEGGIYKMDFNGPENEVNSLHGVYKSIQRYSMLVFTWIWDVPPDATEEETLVSLKFEPTETGTRLTLLHQRFSSEEMRDRHQWGWSQTMDKLERNAALLFE